MRIAFVAAIHTCITAMMPLPAYTSTGIGTNSSVTSTPTFPTATIDTNTDLTPHTRKG